jgi:hypothetical protein
VRASRTAASAAITRREVVKRREPRVSTAIAGILVERGGVQVR